MAGSVLGGIAAAVELRGVLDDVGDESEVEQAAEEDAVTDEPDVESAAEEGVEGAADEYVEAAAVDEAEPKTATFCPTDAGDLNGDVLDDRSPKSGVVQSWQSG